MGLASVIRESLSSREREVPMLIANGHSRREIGALLSLSHWTVADHLSNIRRKLAARSTPHAVATAFVRGEIP